MRENGEIYKAGKNFTLLLAVTAWTNLTSDWGREMRHCSRFPVLYLEQDHVLN